ncbi:MAG: amidohydrolase [Chloroflexi bacterium]|nr:amidohydrolase [Chloroflexota bacterium]
MTDVPRAPHRLALVNGRVYTQDARRPLVQALASVGNRIVAAGSSADALAAAGPEAEVVDLGGRAVVPGFVDAHFHFLGYSFDRQRVPLDRAASIEAVRQLVAPIAAQTSDPDAWIIGRGWDRNLWPGARFPTRHDLDGVTNGRPTMLLSRDVHSVWANTRALELAGITRDTPDPPGGRIEREADGSPSGVLLEAAGERVRALADRPSPEQEVVAARAAQEALLRVGVTGLCNFEGVEAVRALQTLEDAGELRLRVAAGITRGGLRAAAEAGLRTGFGGDRLRIGLLKLFADGALGSGTAAMLAPYDDGGPEDTGIPTIDLDELAGLMREARAAGIGVATHAIGDAAVRLVLDAAERVRADAHPAARSQILRVEHAQIVAPEDIGRFAQLDVVASMQPIHATSDMHVADRRWGDRCRGAYAWRSLLDSGARVAFGTDCPVEPPEPLKSIHAAVTRQRPGGEPPGGWRPEQRVSLAEAIYAYTAGSAAALGWGSRLGRLMPGMLADAVVLTADPYAADLATLAEIAVSLTVFDGRVAYQS